MINLYKVNGQIKARTKLLADYTEAIVANAKQAWLKDRKAEYDELYPKYSIEVTIDEFTEEEVEKQVEIEYEHTFDTWLLETEVVEPAVEEIRNEDGIVEVPYKSEVTKLLREFIVPEVTEDMLDTYLAIRYSELRAKEYPSFLEYIDGIVKGDAEQVQKYIDDCLAVKNKYPKGVQA
jgi:hypothetical protein